VFEFPYVATLGAPFGYVVAWAWVSDRQRLATEVAKALVVAAPLALIAFGSAAVLFPEGWFELLEPYRGALVVPLPLAALGSVTLVCWLGVLWARTRRPARAPRRNPMTRPVVLGFTLAVFLALFLVVHVSGPYPRVLKF
jgi:hypothetical protein